MIEHKEPENTDSKKLPENYEVVSNENLDPETLETMKQIDEAMESENLLLEPYIKKIDKREETIAALHRDAQAYRSLMGSYEILMLKQRELIKILESKVYDHNE